MRKRKSSLKKNMAILVCVAFISLMLPDVTQAAARSSSLEIPFIKQYIFLFASLFSTANYNLQLSVMTFATHTILAKKTLEPVTPPATPPSTDNNGDKKSNDDPVEISGNSKPKKKPNGKD